MLENEDMRVALLSHGAITQGWWLGNTPLILGYEDPTAYLSDPYFMGAMVGRLANRVSGACFDLDGRHYCLEANEGPNQLHGGPDGLWSRSWSINAISPSEALLTFHSPDGDGGYPAAVDLRMTVTLGRDSLTYQIEARPDRPTPLSLAQHNYYCLGEGGLSLHVNAAGCLELDVAQVPTGNVLPLSCTTHDLRTGTALGKDGPDIDHFYLFDADRDPTEPKATLRAKSGLTLAFFSDQPGAQVYTAHGLGHPFAPRAGLCFEPSGYPDAVNCAAFPSVIATPDAPYRQTLRLVVSGRAD
ncbi:MAG: galactose mutarotase [Marivita sp.]|uniref:aldose epimerase family protein n=1 Tax=Marivita sp. TaxID=2003365 RepID=UPI0025BE7BAC|nr:aldose epimerase family protein [Marivita sp.]MCI5110548.1 galactose mutarotase [Marivita sp.]